MFQLLMAGKSIEISPVVNVTTVVTSAPWLYSLDDM